MVYPISIQTIVLPNGLFKLYVPGDAAVKCISAHRPPGSGQPYWARLWPSALALASFLQKNKDLVTGKNVAEIGAGLGLPSLVAAQWAEKVWCSDIEPEAIKVAQKSGALNHLGNIQFTACNWKKLPFDFFADWVLLSDINYAPDDFEELEYVLSGLLKKGCALLLATPQRLMAKSFFEKLAAYITGQWEETVNTNHEQTFISIFTLKCPGKP